ncbi:MAG: PadR family transcriptional regulator [Gemmatimonadaceae bacterium]
MDRELKRGTLEMLILRLLHEKDLYGYEIVTTLTERTDGGITMKEGTLYPVLYRMDDAGFVEPYWETQERAVPRKYYRITDSGKKHLHELEQQWWNFARAVSNIIPKEKAR